MKPNSKKVTLIFGVAILLASASFAQRSDGWVQENWERVSGEVDNFKTRFPEQGTNTLDGATVQQRPMDGLVRHADHQVSSQPVQPLPNTLNADSQFEALSDDSAVTSTAKWTDDIQGQLNKVDWPKVLSSLAIVVGGYLGFVWFMRKANPKMNSGLPSEVFELVGTKRMSAKQTLQLVRLGSKLLLLVHGEEGTHPIAEITDPEEVEYLTSVCSRRTTTRPRGSRPSRPTASGETGFRSAMDRAQREGDSTEAAMDKVIRKLSEMAGKSSRTDYEA